MLNICDRIGVGVPVDLSNLVTWRIVAFAVASEARVRQNFEIGGLFVHLAFSCFCKNFTLWPYYSTYRGCKIPKLIFKQLFCMYMHFFFCLRSAWISLKWLQFTVPKTMYFIKSKDHLAQAYVTFSKRLTVRVPDYGYSRNALYVLN